MGKSTTQKPRRYINQLNAGEIVEDQVFLIGSKDLRTTTNGSLYIHCILCDKTGQLLGRLWQATEAIYEQMPEGGFLRFKGRVENYKGSLQFIVDAVRPVDPKSVDLSEFMPQTSENVDEMFERVKEILRRIKNPHLLNLVKQFITDKTLMEQFRKAPAATQLHHAYIGGLLEHTRNVLELALAVIPRYPGVSLDLVLAGIFLHDLGKTAELTYQTNFQYTNQGQLVGHLVQTTVWIDQKCKAIEEHTGKPFPEDIKHSLQHIILSHHGQYEFGSPKLPATPEAIAIHHLDNLDAKLNMYLNKIANDPDPASDWTEYVRAVESKIFKKDVMGIRGD
ncbi:MAG: HD domain-containing protein [Planctomycetota bacterium]|nr:MAG: HD domain-containing protein [Planctomycetota bacterium]